MGLHEDSAAVRDKAPQLRPAVERKAAPYSARTRSYYRGLSATSVGLEFAIAVVITLFAGLWLDRKLGTSPWLMLLCLCFGFAAGMRGVWRHVAEADRAAKESELSP